MSRIYNNSDESVYVHITWVGDRGTIDTWSMGPHTEKVFRPGWPYNDTRKAFTVTFWESEDKYIRNFLQGLGFAALQGLIEGLANGRGTTVEVFSEIYKQVGSDVMREAFGGKGIVGMAVNVFYNGGWTMYNGRGFACDTGCIETDWPPLPKDRVPKYAWSVDSHRNQTKIYYPGENPSAIWEPLGGNLTSIPAVCSWAPGRLDVFAKGSDNAIWHKWFDGAWRNWESLDGNLASAPTVVSWAPGRLDVFAKGLSNDVWHRWFDGRWSNYNSLGGNLASDPVVCSWAPGKLVIFAKGSDNALWQRWFDGAWRNWESLDGNLASAPTVVSGNGRIDVFVRGSDNAIWRRFFDFRSRVSSWSMWESLGGNLASGPAVCSWAPEKFVVFAKGSDNALWQRWFDGTWRNWESLDGFLTSDPAAVSWPNKRIDVFIRGSDNALWHRYLDFNSRLPMWSSWESLGGDLASGPTVVSGNGRIDVFARGSDNAIWHKWFDGAWRP